MKLRCDHCRGQLGLMIHRYWRMRFCCAACAQAYEQRLLGGTRAKIRLLNGRAGEKPSQSETRTRPGFGQHFAA